MGSGSGVLLLLGGASRSHDGDAMLSDVDVLEVAADGALAWTSDPKWRAVRFPAVRTGCYWRVGRSVVSWGGMRDGASARGRAGALDDVLVLDADRYTVRRATLAPCRAGEARRVAGSAPAARSGAVVVPLGQSGMEGALVLGGESTLEESRLSLSRTRADLGAAHWLRLVVQDEENEVSVIDERL